MELFLNDLSIDGQFPDLATFRGAIDRAIRMRKLARCFGRDVYCHRNLVSTQVTAHKSMQQAIQTFGRDERRSVTEWFTRQGPFWDDVRSHTGDDYLQWNEKIVTETAVGEAAYRCIGGQRSDLISLTPSSWEFSPVPVLWVADAGAHRSTEVVNHRTAGELEVALRACPTPIESWQQLADVSMERFQQLTLSGDAFAHLRGHPFVIGASERILILLDTLNRFKLCFDKHGRRTPDGHRLYQDHFTGEKSWFSDSSEPEKHEFRSELTFHNPLPGGSPLFCSWHGKVKSPQLRIHFSWPIRAEDPLFVVYVGPKITKR